MIAPGQERAYTAQAPSFRLGRRLCENVPERKSIRKYFSLAGPHEKRCARHGIFFRILKSHSKGGAEFRVFTQPGSQADARRPSSNVRSGRLAQIGDSSPDGSVLDNE